MAYVHRYRGRRLSFGSQPSPNTITQNIRYFTELDASVAQYYGIPAVNALANFEFEFHMYRTAYDATSMFVFDSALGNNIGLNVVSSNDYQNSEGDLRITGATGFAEITGLSTFVIYKCRFTYDADTQVSKAYLNDTLFSTSTVTSLPLAINTSTESVIGSSVSGDYGFQGYIWDFNFISGFTQVGNSNGNPLYKLDENFNETNIVTNSTNSGGNGETINIDGVDTKLFTEKESGWEGTELWNLGDVELNSSTRSARLYPATSKYYYYKMIMIHPPNLPTTTMRFRSGNGNYFWNSTESITEGVFPASATDFNLVIDSEDTDELISVSLKEFLRKSL